MSGSFLRSHSGHQVGARGLLIDHPDDDDGDDDNDDDDGSNDGSCINDVNRHGSKEGEIDNDDGSSSSESSNRDEDTDEHSSSDAMKVNEMYDVKQKRCLSAYFSVLQVFTRLFGKSLSGPTKNNLKRNSVKLARCLKPPYPIKMGSCLVTVRGNGILLKKKAVHCNIAFDRVLTAISLQESEIFDYMTAKKACPFTVREKMAIGVLVKHMKLPKSKIPFKKVRLLCK